MLVTAVMAPKRYTSNHIEKLCFSIVSSCKTRSKSSIKKFDVFPQEVTKVEKGILSGMPFTLCGEPAAIGGAKSAIRFF
jgi:hypothetical protein